jgi:maltose alpha-D-glucosyltransferase/alpha-amylase
LTYVAPSGVPTTLAVVQRWVENEGDGWTHLVDQLSTRGHLTERSLEEVSELGRVTAQLHAALASGSDDAAFAPARVTAADLDRWTGALEERAAESVRLLLHGADSWSGDAKQDADWLRGRLSRLPDAVRARTSTSTDFLLIRVHGDYHLGQTLKTRTGFAVIDFEGEPTRPLEERRQKQSALRDVAGLLRSLDYAVRTACSDDTGAMQDGLRQALLSAYFDACERTEHAGAILPRPAARPDWLQFFEVEKAMYELAYELNNRPAWAHIPLRWLRQTAARLLQDDSSAPASSR